MSEIPLKILDIIKALLFYSFHGRVPLTADGRSALQGSMTPNGEHHRPVKASASEVAWCFFFVLCNLRFKNAKLKTNAE